MQAEISITDHPRSRGEHPTELPLRICNVGSSPLARGTPQRRTLGAAVRRIIPARAGNTFTSSTRVSRFADHPRSRGEHDSRETSQPDNGGSSPLARGTRSSATASAPGLRIIPARAGNTHPQPGSAQSWTDHPRSRGEHDRISDVQYNFTGSSPLARGTRVFRSRRADGLRIIPARAGNTAPARCSCAPPPDHPRSRGEHQTPKKASSNARGSSPLARGTPTATPHTP